MGCKVTGQSTALLQEGVRNQGHTPAPASSLPKPLQAEQVPAGLSVPTISLDPLLFSADEPTSPKKPKSVPEPEPGDVEGEAPSPLPSEWTSVRISPKEDAAGQDVLAVCVLVTSDDSRYAQATVGWGQHGLGRGTVFRSWSSLCLLAYDLSVPPFPRL